MTNVYDKAHDLARALQQSEEAVAVDTAMKAIAADPETKQMFDDFRKRQVEMQQQMMAGEMPNPEEMEQMEKLFQVISMNANISALFAAEQRLAQVIQDVNKIVTDSLGHLYQD